MKKQALMDISESRKAMYANKAERLFRGIHEKYQGWLDWIVGRISRYVDVGLEPIVKEMELVYQANNQITDGDKEEEYDE